MGCTVRLQTGSCRTSLGSVMCHPGHHEPWLNDQMICGICVFPHHQLFSLLLPDGSHWILIRTTISSVLSTQNEYCTGKSAQALWNKWKTFSPCQDQDVQPLQAAFTRLQRSSFDPLLHYFQFCPQVGSGRATFFHSDWGLNPEIIIAMNQQKDINSTVTGSHSHSHTYSIKAHTRPKLPMNINALHTHSAKT